MVVQVDRTPRDGTEEVKRMDPLIAFTAGQVLRLTRLSNHQLRYWDQTGFFWPNSADAPRR